MTPINGMALSRLEKSLRLIDSVIATKSKAQRSKTTGSPPHTLIAKDIMFMHILDCIGALSCIRADQRENSSSDNDEEEQASALLSCKHRVFWQVVREIADRKAVLDDIPVTIYEKYKPSVLDCMLECFPIITFHMIYVHQ